MAELYQLFVPFNHACRNEKVRPAPRSCRTWPGLVLGVCVVMMVVAMMVTRTGECRGGKHHQKQGCSEDLFHATNVARTACLR